MSLNERFSQIQFVKQKQHFGFLLNIRGIFKNSATAERIFEGYLRIVLPLKDTRNFVYM